jgi:site-specific recombinase XerD
VTRIALDPDSPLTDLATSFARSLRGERKSPNTIDVYLRAILEYDRYATQHALPRDVARIKRAHVEGFLEDQLDKNKPATASVRHSGLRQFLNWCTDEGEIPLSPMAKMKPPKVPETMPLVLTDEQVEALIASAEGPTFRQRRDQALLLFMADSGCRRSEVAGIALGDINQEQRVALVRGKGDKERLVPYSDRTVAAIDRYLRLRKKHTRASLPALWLGSNGPLTSEGVAEVVRRRSRMAGVTRPNGDALHPHLLRHFMADRALRNGVSEGDLATLGGWVPGSAAMRGYGRGNRTERAHASMRRVFGDI